METHPREGIVKKEKLPNTRRPSYQQVCVEFWNLREQDNQEGGKKKKPTEYVPNCNFQWRSSPDALSTNREQGLNRESWFSCLGQGQG